MGYAAVYCRWQKEIVTTEKIACACKEGEFGYSLPVPST